MATWCVFVQVYAKSIAPGPDGCPVSPLCLGGCRSGRPDGDGRVGGPVGQDPDPACTGGWRRVPQRLLPVRCEPRRGGLPESGGRCPKHRGGSPCVPAVGDRRAGVGGRPPGQSDPRQSQRSRHQRRELHQLRQRGPGGGQPCTRKPGRRQWGSNLRLCHVGERRHHHRPRRSGCRSAGSLLEKPLSVATSSR